VLGVYSIANVSRLGWLRLLKA